MPPSPNPNPSAAPPTPDRPQAAVGRDGAAAGGGGDGAAAARAVSIPAASSGGYPAPPPPSPGGSFPTAAHHLSSELLAVEPAAAVGWAAAAAPPPPPSPRTADPEARGGSDGASPAEVSLGASIDFQVAGVRPAALERLRLDGQAASTAAVTAAASPPLGAGAAVPPPLGFMAGMPAARAGSGEGGLAAGGSSAASTPNAMGPAAAGAGLGLGYGGMAGVAGTLSPLASPGRGGSSGNRRRGGSQSPGGAARGGHDAGSPSRAEGAALARQLSQQSSGGLKSAGSVGLRHAGSGGTGGVVEGAAGGAGGQGLGVPMEEDEGLGGSLSSLTPAGSGILSVQWQDGAAPPPQKPVDMHELVSPKAENCVSRGAGRAEPVGTQHKP